MTIECTLRQSSWSRPIQALVDSGASGIAYISKSLARRYNLNLKRLPEPIDLYGFDGTKSVTGQIQYTTSLELTHYDHTETITMFVTELGKHPIILGLPWMRLHRVTPDWDREILNFTAPRCRTTCRQQEIQPASIENETLEPEPTQERKPETPPGMSICMIGAAAFSYLSKQPDHEVFAISLRDIDKALAKKTETNPSTKVPSEYHDFLSVFSRSESEKLPPHRPYDHQIEVEPGKQHGFGPLYGMSRDELEVLRKYLVENLKKGFVQASTSPVSSPVLFVRKPGGGLRFCVDYRKLNAITIKNRYPIPLIQETLNRLSKAKVYTKLDIIAAFNRLRIAKGDEWLTAFRTRYGLFEYLVMPFGLANAPATFQHYVNDTLRPFLDVFCTAYIDDLLIFSESLHEHRKHVRQVLQALKDAGLQLDVDKCEFHKTEVLYLGLVISTQGIRMDQEKVEAIRNWENPKNVRDVRAFLGFANFYRRFIAGFSDIVTPLVRLTRKDISFRFDSACTDAFEQLKEAFCSAPILRHFNPDLTCVVEADSSDYVTAGVLSQHDEYGVLHPVAYLSKRLNPAECNYEIYDKELLAIVRCFEQWRPELEGAAFPIQVLSDHKNLQYFTTTKQLSHRQARWAEYLSRFNFQITYIPGNKNTKPDALTRRSQDEPAQEDARRNRRQVLLKPEIFKLPPQQDVLNFSNTERTIEQIIVDEYPNDEFIRETSKLIRDGAQRSTKITLADCKLREDRLFFQNRLVLPESDELRLKLLRSVHDAPIGGHQGRARTLDLLQREYYWPKMHETVARYVKSCHVCSRSKASRERKQGLLKPLPVPQRRWRDISVDFIVGLPESQGFSNIMVVVDRLSKMFHVIPCSSITAPETAKLFLTHVWKLHGLPDTIISDRGSQFISAFWDELTTRLGIDARLSTADHPETDGQTERRNAVIEQYLRAYVTYLQDDWSDWCPMAEFTGNNAPAESTSVTPFLANYGQHPRMGFEVPTGQRRPPLQKIQADEANKFVDRMTELQSLLRDEMTWAQSLQQEYANRKRDPAPAYQVGDRVWLDARNIITIRPSKKLDWKKLGPYEITKVVSSHAYRLELPPTIKIHNVLPVSRLTPVTPEHVALPGQLNPPPPAIEVEGEIEYDVEAILDSRMNKRRRQFEYLVRWTGYSDPTWENATDLDRTVAVERYHAAYPDRLRPASFVTEDTGN
jgi:hypothetical protein